MKLYSKRGDDGSTALVGGRRVYKNDIRIAVCGDIDELNCNIGRLVADIGVMPDAGSDFVTSCLQFLDTIQRQLFFVATSLCSGAAFSVCSLDEAQVGALELEIDRLSGRVPELDTFVLPGGCVTAAQSHVCRTVCRRAERMLVDMSLQYTVDTLIMRFMNRLSDYFFILAVNLNFINNIPEKKIYITCK